MLVPEKVTTKIQTSVNLSSSSESEILNQLEIWKCERWQAWNLNSTVETESCSTRAYTPPQGQQLLNIGNSLKRWNKQGKSTKTLIKISVHETADEIYLQLMKIAVWTHANYHLSRVNQQ